MEISQMGIRRIVIQSRLPIPSFRFVSAPNIFGTKLIEHTRNTKLTIPDYKSSEDQKKKKRIRLNRASKFKANCKFILCECKTKSLFIPGVAEAGGKRKYLHVKSETACGAPDLFNFSAART